MSEHDPGHVELGGAATGDETFGPQVAALLSQLPDGSELESATRVRSPLLIRRDTIEHYGDGIDLDALDWQDDAGDQVVPAQVFTTLSTDTGEGLSGDFDPDDPEDLLLYRFDVSWLLPRRDGSDEPESVLLDASYCTQLPAVVPAQMAAQATLIIQRESVDALISSASLKRELEQLSWIGPNDFADDAALLAAAQGAIAADRALPSEQRG